MSKELKKLQFYCKRGWRLFPVSPTSKRPVIKDMLNRASSDMKIIKQWYDEFPGCNWAVSLANSGLVAVDVDHKHGGMLAWEALIATHGEPDTLKQITGSFGFHYVFNAGDRKYRGKLQKGIDVKHNGYILIEPSFNSKGNGYHWKNHKDTPKEVPEWLLELIEKKPGQRGKGSPTYKFGSDFLSKCVEELRKHDLDYEEWTKAGMAIHSADPSDKGLELYLRLTEGASFESGDIEKAKDKWEGFDSSGEVSQASLIWLIKDKGGCVPNPHFEQDKRVFAEFDLDIIQRSKEDWIEFDGRYVISDKDKLVESLNAMGYVFISENVGAPYGRVIEHPNGFVDLTTFSWQQFKEQIKDHAFIFQKSFANKPPELKTVDAVEIWSKHVDRSKYDRVVCEPNARPGELNLWCPIPCKPEPGGIDNLLAFVEHVLCNNDKLMAEHLLDWTAWILQNPDKKPTTVPVLIGAQGTGKGFYFDGLLKKILGPLYLSVTTSRTLTDRFNGNIKQKRLLFIDEAMWIGDHQADAALKNLTGSDTMTVEEKFGAKYTIRNFAAFAIASNNEKAVAIEKNNRRFFVIYTNDQYANDTEYFNPLWKDLRESNLAQRAYNYFLKRDIKDFNPFIIPQNNYRGEEAKISSAGPVGMFWDEVLRSTPIPMFKNDFLIKSFAFQEFKFFLKESSRKMFNPTSNAFWRESQNLIPALRNEQRVSLGKERPRVFKIDPDDLMLSFCNSLQVKPPEDFDPLEYYLDD